MICTSTSYSPFKNESNSSFLECFLNVLTIIQRMKIILILPVLVTFNQNVVNDLFQNTKK